MRGFYDILIATIGRLDFMQLCRRLRIRALFAVGIPLTMLCGCAAVAIEPAGSLKSYDKLSTADGVLTKSKLRVDKADVLKAITIRIAPTSYARQTEAVKLTTEQRKIVSNSVDRALCLGLSERFEVVAFDQPADLTVRAVVTHVTPTNPIAAGVSKVASSVPSFLSLGFPVYVPRIPIGLGALAVEAEARDRKGVQKAAMLWGRGANSFTNSPRMSEAGDAYDLASAFGNDFSKLLNTGESPFGTMPSMPSFDRLGSTFGGAPKYAVCETFGREPGVLGFVGNSLALPPEWTDGGAKPVEN